MVTLRVLCAVMVTIAGSVSSNSNQSVSRVPPSAQRVPQTLRFRPMYSVPIPPLQPPLASSPQISASWWAALSQVVSQGSTYAMVRTPVPLADP